MNFISHLKTLELNCLIIYLFMIEGKNSGGIKTFILVAFV